MSHTGRNSLTLFQEMVLFLIRLRLGCQFQDVILDCFEVFIDRPSSYLPHAETWSLYKHRNTVKFLVGICPQGAVSFLSKAYGGRASDKHVTEE